jgi:carbamoyl-phosphate synthase large subunit
MVEVCEREEVDLVIPATDFEVYHLGLAADRLPPVLASGPDVAQVFLDKHLTAMTFERLGIAFARSCLPSDYDGSFASTVIKPRKGRGSRDVHVDPPSPRDFPDTFIVQERAVGREATCAFYVRHGGELHGLIVLERWLENGTTVACTVLRDEEPVFARIVNQIIEAFAIKGPCNVQAIIRDDGTVVPFEINCRFSGTASIRHHLGFPDIEFAVDEVLRHRRPSPPNVRPGSAVRLLLDVIYPGASLDDIGLTSPASFVF